MFMGKIHVVGLESDSYWNIPWQGKNSQCVNHKIIKTNSKTKTRWALVEDVIREKNDTSRNNIEII